MAILNTRHVFRPRHVDLLALHRFYGSGAVVKREMFTLGDLSLRPGLAVVFGPTGSGKTELVNEMMRRIEPGILTDQAVLDESTEEGNSFTSLAEIGVVLLDLHVPDRLARLEASVRAAIDGSPDAEEVEDRVAAAYDTAIEPFADHTARPAIMHATIFSAREILTEDELASALSVQPVGAHCLVVDSLRLLQFTVPGSIRAGGISNGFFALLTDLDNIARAAGALVIATFNPMVTDDVKKVELLDLLEASVTSTIEVKSFLNFVVKQRFDGRVASTFQWERTDNSSPTVSGNGSEGITFNMASVRSTPTQPLVHSVLRSMINE